MRISPVFLKGDYLEHLNNQKVHIWYRQSPNSAVQEMDGTFYASSEYKLWGVIDIHGGIRASQEIVDVDFYNLPSVREIFSSIKETKLESLLG